MLIKTTKLKKSLSTIMPGIESGRITIEGADLVIFLDKKMLSYNGNVAVSIPMDIGDVEAFGVKAKDLYNLVAKLNEEELDIEADVTGNKLKVKSGKLKATLIMQDVTAISKLLDKLKFGEENALPENFIEASKVVAIAENKTAFKGFAIGKSGDSTMLISTDKVRISAYKLKGDMSQCLINDDLVAQAISFGTPKTYSIVGPWFHLGYEGGAHFSMLRSDDSAFPFTPMFGALERVQTLETLAKFSFPATLAEVADRVTTMGNVDANSKIQCELTISSDKLVVSAEKSTGSAEEEIAWEKPVEIADVVRVWMPVKTLLNLAGKATECKVVSMGGVKKAMVIQSDVYTMMASCSC